MEAPTPTEAVAGATAIEICFGEATKRLAVPLIALHLAVIVDCPTPCPVKTGNLLLAMLATFGEPVVQMAKEETSWVEPSLKVAMAEYVSVPPGGRKAVAGVTAIVCGVADVTVIVPEPSTEAKFFGAVAFTVVVPADSPASVDFENFAGGFVVDHFTRLVRSCVLPSLNIPVAV